MAFINGKRVLCATVNVNAGGEVIKLFTPRISVSGGVLSVEDSNGDFAESYDLYNDTQYLFSFTEKSIKLSDYITENGDYNFMVLVKNPKFVDSELSNMVVYAKNSGTDGLVYALNSTGTEYMCTSIGTATNIANIVVSEEIDGLPVTSIADKAFYKSENMVSITLPYTVRHIGNSAFRDCAMLSEVKLPTELKSIGDYVFANSDTLKYIYMPDSLTTVGRSTFANCDGLTSFRIPTFKEQGTMLSSYMFEKCDGLIDVVIQEGVERLGNVGIFYNCGNLKSVILPTTFKDFGDQKMFALCKSLETVNIPEGTESIPQETFLSCSALRSITIPDSVTLIGIYAFFGCTSLESITIPSNVRQISSHAFSSCPSINVIMLATTPPIINTTTFEGLTASGSITVPAGCGEAYRTAAGWSTYADLIVEAEA